MIAAAEIEHLLRESPSQDSDFRESGYEVWYAATGGPATYIRAKKKLPLFLARVLKRELEARGYLARIEVE